MQKKIFVVLSMILSISMLIMSLAEAKPAKGMKFKHVDKNKDGVVDKKEMQVEKTWEHKQKAQVNTWWEKRADTDGNGKVDANEVSAWKKLEKERIDLNNDGTIDAKERRLCWRHARSRVNTALEKKYDANADGWLEPAEVKELLKDRYTLIKTKGKAKVDTELESTYDTNEDGIIDSNEAEALKEDTQ
jgi:Ca2+-binding EF-hand superfamily protein